MELNDLARGMRLADGIVAAGQGLRRHLQNEVDKYTPVSRRQIMALAAQQQGQAALTAAPQSAAPRALPTIEQIENFESSPRRRQVIEYLMTDMMLTASSMEEEAFQNFDDSARHSADFLTSLNTQLGTIDTSLDAFSRNCGFTEFVVIADLAHLALGNLDHTASSKNELQRWVVLLHAACSPNFNPSLIPDPVFEHAQLRKAGQRIRSDISGKTWNPNPRALGA